MKKAEACCRQHSLDTTVNEGKIHMTYLLLYCIVDECMDGWICFFLCCVEEKEYSTTNTTTTILLLLLQKVDLFYISVHHCVALLRY